MKIQMPKKKKLFKNKIKSNGNIGSLTEANCF